MGTSSKLFSKVPVQIPNKSGFYEGHERLFTAPVGTLVPCLVDELLPNDTVSLGVSSQIQLPPMATDFYGRVYAEYNAFFVPNRILYGGWQELITHPVNGDVYPSGTVNPQKAKYLPQIAVPFAKTKPGTLCDYLGFKVDINTGSYNISNPLPFLAYHKIWDDWYRDSRLQQSCFRRCYNLTVVNTAASMPYWTDYSSSPITIPTQLQDGVDLCDLRQRNWHRDYFTNATSSPQAGNASTLGFSVAGSADAQGVVTGTGSFTIASLRAANALQTWLERNNIAGERYADQIKAQFGILPSDATMDRAIYLGTQRVQVYNKSVYQNSDNSSAASPTNNPFTAVGSKYGAPIGVGDGSLIDHFTASEHGFIIVLFSLIPDPVYGTGSHRMFYRSSAADFAFPLLAAVGDQEIMERELGSNPASTNVFGYTQRYSEYKSKEASVHGLLRDNQSLSAFALKRSYATPVLGSSFLEIPKSALDEVSAVTSQKTSNFGCWVDLWNEYKKSSTLPAYSIPTLGDIKDTHTEVIPNGGRRL